MNQTLSWPSWSSDSWLSHPAENEPDACLASWLWAGGSLTAQLKARCQLFQVQVHASGVDIVYADEMPLLKARQCWVREVTLWGDGKPWVRARSLWPELPSGSEPLRALKAKPLGELLFASGEASATIRQIARTESERGPLWARRSIYQFAGLPVLVQELFLPESPAYREELNGH